MKSEATRAVIHRTALAVVAVASVFLLAVVMIMFLQYRQLKRTDPLDSPALAGLRKQYIDNERGSEQLKEHIRELDLLSRRAWFTGHDLLHSGGFLILGGAIVLLAALQTAASTRPFRTGLSVSRSPDRTAALARRGIAIVGIAVLLLAAAAVLISRSANVKTVPKVVTVPTETTVSAEEISRNWPWFRGPDTIGIADGRKLPGAWDGKTGKGILWKSEIPLQGYNSPVVWGGRVFVSGGNKQVREIYCFNTDDGKLLWRHAADNITGSPAKPPAVTEDTGFAAPTMAVDGKRAFAIFATGDLVCADFAGKRLWAVNLGNPKNHYGYSSSPVIADGKLIVQFFDEDRQLLLALNPATGKPVWSASRKTSISWSSPSVINVSGRKLIVTLTCDAIEAFDAASGSLVWQLNCMGGEVGTSATYSAGRLFAANDNACAVAINAADGKELWKTNELTLPDVSSPVAAGDMLYLFSSSGVVTCADAANGKKLWEKELTTGFYCSPLLISGRIIVFNMEGIAFIIKPDREKYIQEAVCELGEKVVATPAVVDGKIYIRTDKFLYCIGDKTQIEMDGKK
ncbi:MAG: outer membrane protein assembly factor BamB family protein [Victivallaceae bacterium]